MRLRNLSTDSLVGDYCVRGELARERFAWSYAAEHERLARSVTLKVLAPLQRFRGSREQFVREVEILDCLRHPGAPRVYDCGELADGRPWFAIDGRLELSLAGAVAHGAQIDCARVVLELASVVAHAHGRGIAHRNLRIDAISCGTEVGQPALRVDDWSCARAATLADRHADIRAIGAIAYQVLSGVLALGVVGANGTATTRFPRASRPLTQLIDRMLASDPRVQPDAEEVLAIASAIVHGTIAIAASASASTSAPAPIAAAADRFDVGDVDNFAEVTRVHRIAS